MNETQPAMKPLTILDPLRGCAALWVFLFHLIGNQHPIRIVIPGAELFIRHGYLGVPLFFVISGYCITASAWRTSEKGLPTSNFITRRLCRIYPTLWCSIIVVFACSAFLPLLRKYCGVTFFELRPILGWEFDFWAWVRMFSLTEAFSSEMVTKMVDGEAVETLKRQPNFFKFNGVYWTLAIEVQFYLATAAMLLWRKHFKLLFLILTLISLPMLNPAWRLPSGHFLPFWSMFALGGGLFFIHRKGKFFPSHTSWKVWMPIASLLLAVGFYLLFNPEITGNKHQLPFRFGFALLFTIGLWFWIDLAPKVGSYKIFQWSRWNPFVYLGMISYSLYLVHMPISRLLHSLAKPTFDTIIPYQVALIDLGILVVTTLLSGVFYYFCERPVVAWLSSHKKSTHEKATQKEGA